MVRDRKHVRGARERLLEGIGVPGPKPFSPDPYQLEAIAALNAGYDTLVIAPTGAGKTYIAIEAIRTAAERGERAVYTAPLKALSNAKYAELKKRFEPQYLVGLLTGDRKIETNAQIVVATTEIYRNELYSMRENSGIVVLDEFHYLADPQRGAVWEESVILSSSNSTLLMLSASISNPQEVAEWVQSVRQKEVKIVQVEKRPVELRLAFLHPDLGVIPLEDERGLFPEVTQFYVTGQHRQAPSGGRRKFFRGGGGRSNRKRGGKGGRGSSR